MKTYYIIGIKENFLGNIFYNKYNEYIKIQTTSDDGIIYHFNPEIKIDIYDGEKVEIADILLADFVLQAFILKEIKNKD